MQLQIFIGEQSISVFIWLAKEEDAVNGERDDKTSALFKSAGMRFSIAAPALLHPHPPASRPRRAALI